MPRRSRSAAVVEDPPVRSRRHRGPIWASGYRILHAWELPFPEFPAFTHINDAACTAEHVLAPHRHRHLEICVLTKGRAEWSIGGRSFRLRAGDAFLAWPGEVHAGRPDPHDPQRNFAVGIDPRKLPSLGGGSADADILSALAQLEGQAERWRVIHQVSGAERILRALLCECDAAARTSGLARALSLAQVQTLLIELLVLICRRALCHDAAARPGDRLAGLEDWLGSRLADPPSVAEMAAWAELSSSHLTQRCRAAYGCTPLELMTKLRIVEAARLLSEGKGLTVTQTAIELGFSSSQYFATVFRGVMGKSPSDYQHIIE